MKDRLVSIVLPVYNGSQYLKEAIESCISQSYQNWELIIVDDASIDQTPDIISEFLTKDNRIRSIRHQNNKKLPAALNTGFAIAKGDYFTWTSDDNFYHQKAIERMVGFLQENPLIDVVYTDYTIIDENGKQIRDYIVEDPNTVIYRSCMGASFMYTSNVHHTLKGFDEELFLVEDYDFWLRAYRYFKMEPLHENLYFYRRHSKSLTDQHNERIFILTRKAMARYESEDFQMDLDIIKQRPIFIWGTGNGGKYTYKSLQTAGLEITGFVDSNPEKWGKTFLDLRIYTPDELRKFPTGQPFIFIGSIYIDQIEKRLQEMNCRKGFDFTINILSK